MPEANIVTSLLRAHFDRELADLQEAILLLGSRARHAGEAGVRAFLENDPERAGEVVVGDQAINDLRFEIERRCYALLAREQPVAGDMRVIVTALTIASELERIGDHAKKIAQICQRTCGESRPIPLVGIDQMREIALSMLDDALSTISTRDVDAARVVSSRDDLVDALYKQTFNVTLTYMLESNRAISAGTHLIQVAHELERVADRATNIAERVIYVVSGELVDLNA
jgi:phosphate transport system protein